MSGSKVSLRRSTLMTWRRRPDVAKSGAYVPDEFQVAAAMAMTLLVTGRIAGGGRSTQRKRRSFTGFSGSTSTGVRHSTSQVELNLERIAAPRGSEWNASTINGSRKRLNGIINNRLYIGEIVYNRQRFIKDPMTGRRQARPNPPSEWLEKDVPDLAIVPLELFEAAQHRRGRYCSVKLDRRRRPKHLLSGLVACGCCGASMIVVRDDRVGCSARINRKTCANRRTIRLAEIERRVLKVLQEHLLAADVVALAIEAYRIESERLVKSQAKSRREAERDLAAVTRKISGVITAIEAGGDPRSLAMRINELEAERRAIETRLPSADPQQVLAIHPKTAQRYEQRIAEIHTALSKGDEAAREAVELVRELIDRIVVTPTDDGEPMKLELVGNVAALLEEQPLNTGAIVAVACPRNQHNTQ